MVNQLIKQPFILLLIVLVTGKLL